MLNLQFQGFELYPSVYIESPKLKPMKKAVKKYKQRRLKRWARNPNHWEHTYFTQGNLIFCSYADYQWLKEKFKYAK